MRITRLAGLIILISLQSVLMASVPPHRNVMEKIKRGEIPVPYYMRYMKEIRELGYNVPWKTTPRLGSGIDRTPGRAFGPVATPSGDYNALVVLVKFKDDPDAEFNFPWRADSTLFDDRLFGPGEGTMRDYYDKVSYGALNLTTQNLPSTIGVIQADHVMAYYVNGENGFGRSNPDSSVRALVVEVMAKIDPVVDFAPYDNTGDGYVDALFLVHAGPGAEYTGSDDMIWSHSSSTTEDYVTGDGVSVSRYTTEPEYWAEVDEATGETDMTVGVYAHEAGHMIFGLPDVYDTDDSSEGLGDWSLMAGGSWNGSPSGPGGDFPAFPDAWSHIEMGYVSAINVTADIPAQQINNIVDSDEIYRLWSNGSSGGQEYFLVQNRQQKGYDTYLPGSGLAIFHVDDSRTNNKHEWYPGLLPISHYLVALEQADGRWNLEAMPDDTGGVFIQRGDDGDLYPGSTGNRAFGSFTVPDSRKYGDMASFVSIRNISDPADIMTADFSIFAAPVMVVEQDTVDLGTGYVGVPMGDTLYITNTGRDPLTVNISPSTTNLNLEELTVEIDLERAAIYFSYTPDAEGPFSAMLIINSDDPVTPSDSVYVSGSAFGPPVMVTAPAALTVTVDVAGTDLETITIDNSNGQMDLAYEIKLSDSARTDTLFTDQSYDWLTFSTDSGSVAAGASVNIDVSIDAGALASDVYQAFIHILNNDPHVLDRVVGIQMAVTPLRAANITTLADVPDDGGRMLNITWDASVDDATGSANPVAYYRVWLRDEGTDPFITPQPVTVNGTDGWGTFIESIGATEATSYTATVPTHRDSNAVDRHWSYLNVSAHMADNSVAPSFSTVARGYSIDSQGPSSPTRLRIRSMEDSIFVSWRFDFAGNPDFSYFNIYRDTVASFEPDVALPYATVYSASTITNYFSDRGGRGGQLYYYRVAAVDYNGNIGDLSAPTTGGYMETDPGQAMPRQYALGQNYPNPFNPTTTINLEIPQTGRVELTIYDLLGREIVKLVDGVVEPGKFTAHWSGRDAGGAAVPSGIYFARMQAAGFSQTIKMLLLK